MKDIKYVIATAILLFIAIVQVAAINIKGGYGQYMCRSFYVGYYQNGSYQLCDSFRVNVMANFNINIDLPKKLEKGGQLIIACADGKTPETAFTDISGLSAIEFVHVGKDIEYTSSWRSHTAYLKFKTGGEGYEAYHSLAKEERTVYEHINRLETLLQSDSINKKQFKKNYKELKKIVKSYNKKCDKAIKSFPKKSYMHERLKFFKYVLPPQSAWKKDIAVWKREHMFDHLNLKNPILLDISSFYQRMQDYVKAHKTQEKDIAIEKLHAMCKFPIIFSAQ